MTARHGEGLKSIAGIVVFVAALAALAAASCDDDPDPTDEICDNGRDDDGNYAVDCEDIACMEFPGCEPSPDGDADVDADGDVDGDVDGDADGGGDATHDAEAGDADVEQCDLEAGPCDGACGRDEHCSLALDLRSCCGGFPHRVAGELTVCATAALSEVLEDEPCVIAWAPGDPLPSVPSSCEPTCTGILCGACPEPARAVCRGGECIAVTEEGCGDDGDCDEGQSCVDVDLDGYSDCIEGTHECDLDEDCAAAYPDCSGCSCQDYDIDGLRECECTECDVCFSDLDCAAHEFCIDDECVWSGDDACRSSIGNVDCPACYLCEARETPDRGVCVRDADCTNCTEDADCDPNHFCVAEACAYSGADACRVDLAELDCEFCEICDPSVDDTTRGTCVTDPAC